MKGEETEENPFSYDSDSEEGEEVVECGGDTGDKERSLSHVRYHAFQFYNIRGLYNMEDSRLFVPELGLIFRNAMELKFYILHTEFQRLETLEEQRKLESGANTQQRNTHEPLALTPPPSVHFHHSVEEQPPA